MKLFDKIKYNAAVLRIKIFSWEYWPMWVVYFPASFYFIYLCIKARSFFFFSAANPSIETGGMFFESKWKIFELIPKKYFPATVYVDEECDTDLIISKMNFAGIVFPVIAKPDRGERGWCVKKIYTRTELFLYRQQVAIPFLIQSYVDFPLEFSVFYYRHPGCDKGLVTSVTLKEMLSVTGDGYSSLQKLIYKNDRAILQLPALKKMNLDFNKVLNKGEKKILVPYGNHVRGAKFLDYTHIADDQMNVAFDVISKSIPGFYFGRYDLRCTSIEDLKQGKNIAVLELNGSGAEPAHIYQPGYSFFKAQKVITAHYKMMYAAAIANNKRGVPYMNFDSFKATRAQEKLHKQKALSLDAPFV